MPFELKLHPNAALAINGKAVEILSKISLDTSTARPRVEWGEIPPVATITDEDILGDVLMTEADIHGKIVSARFSVGSDLYLLSGDDFLLLNSLIEQVFKISRLSDVLGEKYVFNLIVNWCRTRLESEENSKEFSAYLSEKVAADVKSHEIWVPIAELESQEDFNFGPCRVLTITGEFFDDDEKRRITARPDLAENFKQFSSKYKRKLQGVAAVAVHVEAENDHAMIAAIARAEVAIGLLRLYSFAAYNPWVVCPCAIFGSEYTPSSLAISIGDDRKILALTERGNALNAQPWRISSVQLGEMQANGLTTLGDLAAVDGLSDFSVAVKTSILTYSSGLTFSDISDRLVYTLSALESLLLKDSSEPIQQNLGERMAFMISKNGKERRKIVADVKQVYQARSQYVHHRRISAIDRAVFESFIVCARTVFQGAFQNHKAVQTKADFISHIDRIKFGG